jgi:hypothetical protein
MELFASVPLIAIVLMAILVPIAIILIFRTRKTYFDDNSEF